MRRCAVRERSDQVAKLLLGLLLGEAECLEHLGLKLGIVDTDRTAAQLAAVQDNVVSLGAYLGRVGVEQRNILVHRRGERMVHRNETVLLLAVLELRELGDPEELEVVLLREAETLCQLAAQCAQSDGSNLPVCIGDNEQQVVLLRACALLDGRDLVLGQELGKGRGHAAISGELHPREALCAVGLDELAELVDLLARELVRVAVYVDETDRTAVLDGVLEHLERAVLCNVGNILDLKAEADVRLVRAVLVHGVLPGHARQRELNVNIEHFLEHALEEALVDCDHVILLNERHLKVDLGELRLTVGTQVLVAEAAGDLDVAVHAGQHEQLLVLLRRLRQGVELARMYTGRHEVVARALRGGLGEHRGLDLEEAVLIEVVAGYLRYAVAQHEVALHGRAAQVKVAVLQTDLVADFLGVVDLERSSLRLGQDADVLRDDLDLAGRHLLVDSSRIARDQLALDRYNELGAAGEGNVEQIGVDRLVEGALYDACAVAQQQEQYAAVVAHAVDPAVNGNGLACVLQTKLTAHMRALHACNRCVIHVLSILIPKICCQKFIQKSYHPRAPDGRSRSIPGTPQRRRK